MTGNRLGVPVQRIKVLQLDAGVQFDQVHLVHLGLVRGTAVTSIVLQEGVIVNWQRAFRYYMNIINIRTAVD